MKITISGRAGTGTTSVAKRLAALTEYEFKSAGGMGRELADSMGISIYELDNLTKTDQSFHHLRDKQVSDYAKEHDNFIFEGWFTWNFVPDALKIKLICDLDTRLSRVASRESLTLEEARQKTIEREENNELMSSHYGFHELMPDEAFDLIIDSTHKGVEEITQEILTAIESLQATK